MFRKSLLAGLSRECPLFSDHLIRKQPNTPEHFNFEPVLLVITGIVLMLTNRTLKMSFEIMLIHVHKYYSNRNTIKYSLSGLFCTSLS